MHGAMLLAGRSRWGWLRVLQPFLLRWHAQTGSALPLSGDLAAAAGGGATAPPPRASCRLQHTPTRLRARSRYHLFLRVVNTLVHTCYASEVVSWPSRGTLPSLHSRKVFACLTCAGARWRRLRAAHTWSGS